jgi:hypothetical protein
VQPGRPGSKWIQPCGARNLPADPVRFRLDFLPFVKAKVNHYGLEIDGHCYQNPEALAPFLNAKDPKATTKTKKTKFTVRHDKNDLGYVYFWNPNTKEYVAIPSVEDERHGVTAGEERERKQAIKLCAEVNRDHHLVPRLKAENRTLVEAAKAATKDARKRHATRSAKKAVAREKADEIKAMLPIPVRPIRTPAAMAPETTTQTATPTEATPPAPTAPTPTPIPTPAPEAAGRVTPRVVSSPSYSTRNIAKMEW